MKFTNLMEERIPLTSSIQKQYYKFFAKAYIRKISKKDFKLIFFNRKKFMLKSNYYSDGFLQTNQSHLYYEKAYKFNTKLYLFNVEGVIANQIIRAKEVVYNGHKDYILKYCTIIESSKILRRKSFLLRER